MIKTCCHSTCYWVSYLHQNRHSSIDYNDQEKLYPPFKRNANYLHRQRKRSSTKTVREIIPLKLYYVKNKKTKKNHQKLLEQVGFMWWHNAVLRKMQMRAGSEVPEDLSSEITTMFCLEDSCSNCLTKKRVYNASKVRNIGSSQSDDKNVDFRHTSVEGRSRVWQSATTPSSKVF